MNRYEEISREYIEGTIGLFTYESHEMVMWNVQPREVQVGIWMLQSLTNPKNRSVLEELMEQSKVREAETTQ